jgi:hypothetical protein
LGEKQLVKYFTVRKPWSALSAEIVIWFILVKLEPKLEAAPLFHGVV